MGDVEPIILRPVDPGETLRSFGPNPSSPRSRDAALPVCFTRVELNTILNLYGRMVAAGEWRDYALDMGRDKAVFSVFRRASEVPLYRIEKNPKLARKQGAFSVLTPTGLILKRGSDLRRIISVLDKRLRVVDT